MRSKRKYLGIGSAILACAFALSAVLPSSAQDTSVIIRTLRSGADFRVRVQAAFALGNTRDASMRRHLERALREPNPAVRAAAATALGRLGDARARRALRRARRDDSAAVRMQVTRSLEMLSSTATVAPTAARRVPSGSGGIYPATVTIPRANEISWPRIRYVVVLGDVENQSNYRNAEPLLGDFRSHVRRNLNLLRGVAVFESARAIPAQARRQIQRRSLPTLRLDGNLVNVNRSRRAREVLVRCEVNLVVLTEPGRDLRGMMSGAATGSEVLRRAGRREQETRLAGQALSAAVRSAMSSASSALHRAAHP
ncbi:MAG: HEAT repeat domain-containing protein [Polyangiales bacterium]